MTGRAGIPARYFLTGRAGIKKNSQAQKCLGAGKDARNPGYVAGKDARTPGEDARTPGEDARTPGKQKAPLSQGLIYYEKRPPRQ